MKRPVSCVFAEAGLNRGPRGRPAAMPRVVSATTHPGGALLFSGAPSSSALTLRWGKSPSSWDRAPILVFPLMKGGHRRKTSRSARACVTSLVPALPPSRVDREAEAFRGRSAVLSPRLSSRIQVPKSEKHRASRPPWFFALVPRTCVAGSPTDPPAPGLLLRGHLPRRCSRSLSLPHLPPCLPRLPCPRRLGHRRRAQPVCPAAADVGAVPQKQSRFHARRPAGTPHGCPLPAESSPGS